MALPMKKRCEWWGDDTARCRQQAEFWTEAIWSAADFGTWYTCADHVLDMEQSMRSSRPDGHSLESMITRAIEVPQ